MAIEAHEVYNPAQIENATDAQKNKAMKVIREFNEIKEQSPERDDENESVFDSTPEKPTESMFDLYQKNKDNLLYNYFSIKIIDQGEGISKDGIKKLFVDFSRLKENQVNNQRGTGLGLSICKQLIHKMGGKVNVKSKLGQGTTFTID